MRLAERFGLPVLTFVDTAGAYPGIDAEARGQAEAIARAIETCLDLRVPLVAAVIGEGGSGGAIALAAGNAVLMLEHAVYSVISPEGCASILWRDGDARAGRGRGAAADRAGSAAAGGHRPDRAGAAGRRASPAESGDRRARRGDRRGVAAAVSARRRQPARATPRKVPRDGRKKGCDRARLGRFQGSLTALRRSPHLGRRVASRSAGVLPEAAAGADALYRSVPLFPQRKAAMTPQEQDLLSTLLARLKSTASQPKDPEADGAHSPGDGRAAGRALFSGPDRADPGSEPAQRAEPDRRA